MPLLVNENTFGFVEYTFDGSLVVVRKRTQILMLYGELPSDCPVDRALRARPLRHYPEHAHFWRVVLESG